MVAFTFSLPFLASAEPQELPPAPSLIANLLYTLLPIVFIAVFIWFFFVRSIRKVQERGLSAQSEQREHQERLEKLLERIARALEEQNKNPN